MNVRTLKAISVTKMPTVLTLLEVTHVLVCWASQEMELLVKVCKTIHYMIFLVISFFVDVIVCVREERSPNDTVVIIVIPPALYLLGIEK